MKQSRMLPYVEGALVIAMAVILGMIRIFNLPWGGSVTLLSMLPISLYSIKYGVRKGLEISFIFALFQFIQGISDGLFAWGLTPVMLISCIFLDYLLAYTIIGLAGIFRNKGAVGWISGTVIALIIRFFCHFISGALIFNSFGKLWDGFSTDNTYLYSLVYNGAYMLPEIIFTSVGAYVIFRVPVMKKLIVSTKKAEASH
ncbi:MAG: energy-coupled thiamine transporter ThiT [Ruminococcus sp.]|nr:energy-coupled thiamine transporter ThiT [Ruminococcus sp.]